MPETKATHPRHVAFTKLHGGVFFPIGIHFHGVTREIDVSTVCLEGGYLEDPLSICAPETGFETMVFVDGCSFFSLYTEKYATKSEAKIGHRRIIKGLRKGKIRMTIPVTYYISDEENLGKPAEEGVKDA